MKIGHCLDIKVMEVAPGAEFPVCGIQTVIEDPGEETLIYQCNNVAFLYITLDSKRCFYTCGEHGDKFVQEALSHNWFKKKR